MLGRVLVSRYQIIRAMAQGGFGKTFLAEDILLPGKPHCVVKQLKVSQEDTAALKIARRLFDQEAITLQKLGKHSQIPQLFAFFEEDHEFFLVQELIEGISLKDEYTRKGLLSESQCIAFLRDSLETLNFVHQLGVIHRDIKPANLMRRQSDGRIVFLDFGAVKEIEVDQSLIAETTVSIGTRGYMPDEQLRGKPQLSSDIYALGMTCLQGLTGTHPRNFERDDFDEIRWTHLVSLQPQLEQLISKMVRRDPRHRFSKAADVLHDLEQLLDPNFYSSSTIQADPNVSSENIDNHSSNLPNTDHLRSFGAERSNQGSFEEKQTNLQNHLVAHKQNTPSSVTPLEENDEITNPSVDSEQLTSSNTPTDIPSLSSPENISLSAPDPSSSIRLKNNGFDGEPESGVKESIMSQSYPSAEQTFSQNSEVSSTGETIALSSSSYQAHEHLNNVQKRSSSETSNSLKWVIPSSLILLSGAGLGLFFLLKPSPTDQVLVQIDALYNQKKFADCILLGEKALLAPDVSNSLIRDALAKCYLSEAQAMTVENKYAEALKIAAKVPSDSSLYDQTKEKIESWSTHLLTQARTVYEEKGQIQDALSSLAAIPKNSSQHAQAAQLSKKWKDDTKTSERILAEAQEALDDKQPEQAIEKAKQVKHPKFWKSKADKIILAANKLIESKSQAVVIPKPLPAPAPAWTPAPAPAPRPWPTPAPRAWD